MNEPIFIADFSLSLERNFFLRDTEIVAKELIGKILVKKSENNCFLAGRIVEAEAYLSQDDGASHSATGLSKRNAPMFAEGGILYVYKIYGIHHCINFVTGEPGKGSAVLIRALEPVSGTEEMKKNRNNADFTNLCRGPGNVAKAYLFGLCDNFSSLCSDELFIQRENDSQPFEIVNTTRIGITKSAGLLLRYYLKNSEFVSGKLTKNLNKILEK